MNDATFRTLVIVTFGGLYAIAVGLAVAMLRPSERCSETCAVLDGKALAQWDDRAICWDSVTAFVTTCEE